MQVRIAFAILVFTGCGGPSGTPDGGMPCAWVMGTPVELSGIGGAQHVSLLRVEAGYLLAEDAGAQTFVSRAASIDSAWTMTAILDIARVGPTFVLLDAPYLISALNNAPVRSQILAQRFTADGTFDGTEVMVVEEGSHVFAPIARNASELVLAYVDYSADDSAECLTSSTSAPCVGLVSAATWTTGGTTSPPVALSGALVYSDESPRKLGASVIGDGLVVGWTETKVGSEAVKVAEYPTAALLGMGASPASRYVAVGTDGVQPLLVWEDTVGARLVPADDPDGAPIAEVAGGHVAGGVSIASGYGAVAIVVEASLRRQVLLTDSVGTSVITLPEHSAGNTSAIAGPGPSAGFIVAWIGASGVAQGVEITCQ